MGIFDILRFKKWQPDLEREPPPQEKWPDHTVSLNGKKCSRFINKYPLSVVDFWAPWCQPCKEITPQIRKLSKMYIGKVAFGKINIENNKMIAKEYHVMGIPNLFFFSYGEKITNISGVRQIGIYQEKIDGLLERFEM